jgi:predicted MFS family arabinose efflux permease
MVIYRWEFSRLPEDVTAMTLTDRLLRLALVLAFSSLVVLGCLVARAAMEFRADYEARVLQGLEVPGL